MITIFFKHSQHGASLYPTVVKGIYKNKPLLKAILLETAPSFLHLHVQEYGNDT